MWMHLLGGQRSTPPMIVYLAAQMAQTGPAGTSSNRPLSLSHRPPSDPSISRFCKEQWFLLAEPSSGCEVCSGRLRGPDVDSMCARLCVCINT